MNARNRPQLVQAAMALEATPYLNLYDAEGTRVVPDTRRLARLIRLSLPPAPSIEGTDDE